MHCAGVLRGGGRVGGGAHARLGGARGLRARGRLGPAQPPRAAARRPRVRVRGHAGTTTRHTSSSDDSHIR